MYTPEQLRANPGKAVIEKINNAALRIFDREIKAKTLSELRQVNPR